jgi:hypothetical protein
VGVVATSVDCAVLEVQYNILCATLAPYKVAGRKKNIVPL